MLKILSLSIAISLLSSFPASVLEPSAIVSTSAAEERADDTPRIFFGSDLSVTDCAKARENSETHFEMKGKSIVLRCYVSGTLQDKHFLIKVETHGPDMKTESLDYNGTCLHKDLTFTHTGKYHIRVITDGRDAELSKDIHIE